MELLTNKVFSKRTLSENFSIKLFLNRGIEWELRGWKLIILRTFFSQTISRLIVLQFWDRTREY